jgi:hypothetical protein
MTLTETTVLPEQHCYQMGKYNIFECSNNVAGVRDFRLALPDKAAVSYQVIICPRCFAINRLHNYLFQRILLVFIESDASGKVTG